MSTQSIRAIRVNDHLPVMLTLNRDDAPRRPARTSIGARRNPDSTRAILAAAAELLRGEGLNGLSMDAVARRARCGKPTIYRWWPTRAALLADLHDQAFDAGARPTLGAGRRPLRIELSDATRGVQTLWQTTLAGVALRGLIAEAQADPAAAALLNERCLPRYIALLEDAFAESGHGPSTHESRLLLDLLIAGLLTSEGSAASLDHVIELICSRRSEPTDAVQSPAPTSSAGATSAPLVIEACVESVRYRNDEWID